MLNHPELGEIILSRTRRSRRINISVRRGGRIRLSMPLWGELGVALRFVEENKERIKAAQERMAARGEGDADTGPKEQEELRRRAKEYLPGRVAELSHLTGLGCGKVTVRASRTRWGSCSSRNDISLSLYLMRLPEELIDFVIIHELCHTVHKNHSDKFHRLLDYHVGGREKELSAKLRRYRTA